MKKVLLFAGTSEGRLLAKKLLASEYLVHICVATEYGREVLESHEHLTIHEGRMNVSEMEQLMKSDSWCMVVDATHPYAVEVSKNIRTACEADGQTYVRLLRREESPIKYQNITYVDSIEEAAKVLNESEENILLTTGSKELSKYVEHINDQNRIYARILSDTANVEHCRNLGLSGKQIICMQGPFSAELNAAMLKQIQAKYLVTKDTGAAGGFSEKLQGAKMAGAKVLVVRRPVEEQGFSMEQVLEMLGAGREASGEIIEKRESVEVSESVKQENSEKLQQKITILGIGMGGLDDLTLAGKKALEEADVILGSSRLIESLKCFGKETVPIYEADKIIDYIQKHPEKRDIVAAFSGDVGFYSGTKKLQMRLAEKGISPRILCGISSVVYFASRLGIAWEDMKLVSIHGRNQNVIAAVKDYKKVFLLAGYQETIRNVCQELLDFGLSSVKLSVGCQLGYENESVTCGTPEELLAFSKEGLCVAVIENELAGHLPVTHGLPDPTFERGNAPMTKEEIRSISLSKLALTKDAIVYDVGAGTGSIGLECALQATDGTVYGIEKKADALSFLEINKKKLGVSNFTIVPGEAPEALRELPAPTHAFIGGSSGNLKEIVELLLLKNPKVRMVINCIAMETVAEVMNLLKEIPFEEQEIVQVFVGKSKELGRYHMMMGQNPVYIITLQRK